MKINGIDYLESALDFTNIVCDLEDQGIDIMGMLGTGTSKPMTLCRALVSVYTGEKDLVKCGRILTDHIKNGGSVDEIIEPFNKAMVDAGFTQSEEPAEKRKTATKAK